MRTNLSRTIPMASDSKPITESVLSITQQALADFGWEDFRPGMYEAEKIDHDIANELQAADTAFKETPERPQQQRLQIALEQAIEKLQADYKQVNNLKIQAERRLSQSQETAASPSGHAIWTRLSRRGFGGFQQFFGSDDASLVVRYGKIAQNRRENIAMLKRYQNSIGKESKLNLESKENSHSDTRRLLTMDSGFAETPSETPLPTTTPAPAATSTQLTTADRNLIIIGIGTLIFLCCVTPSAVMIGIALFRKYTGDRRRIQQIQQIRDRLERAAQPAHRNSISDLNMDISQASLYGNHPPGYDPKRRGSTVSEILDSKERKHFRTSTPISPYITKETFRAPLPSIQEGDPERSSSTNRDKPSTEDSKPVHIHVSSAPLPGKLDKDLENTLKQISEIENVLKEQGENKSDSLIKQGSQKWTTLYHPPGAGLLPPAAPPPPPAPSQEALVQLSITNTRLSRDEAPVISPHSQLEGSIAQI